MDETQPLVSSSIYGATKRISKTCADTRLFNVLLCIPPFLMGIFAGILVARRGATASHGNFLANGIDDPITIGTADALWRPARREVLDTWQQSKMHFTPMNYSDPEKPKKIMKYCASLGLRWCPKRFEDADMATVSVVNDWHYHMLRDTERNDFYWKALSVAKDKSVVCIGSGSGILDMMAAKLGAKRVDGIEASKQLSEIASRNVKQNGLDSIVHIHNTLSTQFSLDQDEKADVLVAEILGATLQGESSLHYVADARKRLLKPGGTVIPAAGVQYATLVQSNSIWESYTASSSHGINLEAMNSLTNTATVLANSEHGFMMDNAVPMSARTAIFGIDWTRDNPEEISTTKTLKIIATANGPVHAIVMSWSVWADRERTLELNVDHFTKHRRAAWHLMLQVVAEEGDERSSQSLPKPFHVSKGEVLQLDYLFVPTGYDQHQFRLRRV